jgi:hypothetical protein
MEPWNKIAISKKTIQAIFIEYQYCMDTILLNVTKTKTKSMVWVRERTIPTERPPLVGEVIANLCG